MPRWLILVATVLCGIIPATLTLLANALYYVRAISAIPEGVSVTVAWSEIAFLCAIGSAGGLGYVALFFAARVRVNGRIAIGLLVGVVAMLSAIWLGLSPYWLGSPVLVALAHVVGHLMRRRRQAADGEARSTAAR
jgi:hypothetical protein